MARERMVTRTIEVMEYGVMCVNTQTQTVTTQVLTLTGTVTDEKALKLARKQFETEHLKVVTICHKNVTEELYGMPESEFIKLAKVLPPR